MTLASYAMDVRASRGRRHPEAPHPYRSDYARDRDRVIHSRAFRRLEAKTQVFTKRFSDHFRNRLTHTIEVAQIARTVAGALELNGELVEALALVHDIGHPPFGHAGERRLDAHMRDHGSYFDHNLHALRIVEQFEQRYLEFPGLNLTFEVREGIVKHSGHYSAQKFPELAEYNLGQQPPLESQLIDLVDEIAYDTADLDDSFEARLLDLDLLRKEVPMFGAAYSKIDHRHPAGATKLKFNEALKSVLNSLATDLIENIKAKLDENHVGSVEQVRALPGKLVEFSGSMKPELMALKRFLHSKIYSHPILAKERERSVAALDSLFVFFLENPDRMPRYYAEMAQREPRHRVVCDYIAGMTDHFLLRQRRELLVNTAQRQRKEADEPAG